MDSWILTPRLLKYFCIHLALIVFHSPVVQAQFVPIAFKHNTQKWWRNGATLDLDFANDRYYLNGTSYSDISTFLTAAGATFSRTTTATYFDAAGALQTAAINTPRIHYDPVTHSRKGILIEGAATNLLTISSALNTLSMLSGTPTATANTTIAPDGTLTADTLSNASGMAFFYKTFASTVASGASVTFSVYLKDLTGTVNLSWAGASQVTGGSMQSASVGNGWSRYWLTGTTAIVNPNISPQIYLNGAASVVAWGGQVEVGTIPTSYIPTSGSAVTRNLDSISIPTASWLNVTAGTLFVSQEYTQSVGDYSPILGASQADSFGVAYQGASGNNIGILLNGTIGTLTGALGGSNTYRTALSYSASKIQISKNGATAIVGGSTKNLSTATTMYIGRDFNGTAVSCKSIRRITYFGIEMSAASLADLSR